MTEPLHHLLPRWEDDPVFRWAVDDGSGGIVVADAVRSFLVAGVAAALEACLIAVVPTEPEAQALREATREFSRAALLAAWDVLPYEGLSPDARIAADRVEAVQLLARSSGPRVIVASARGFVQKPAPGTAEVDSIVLRVGESHDRDELSSRLVELGYVREDVADDPGTFAVRGGVVDVFGAQDRRITRAELFGDDIESLREVDPSSQRSVAQIDRATIGARAELAPTRLVRERAAAAVEVARARRDLTEVADRLARLAEGAYPDGAESVLPRIWQRDTDGLAAIAPAGTRVVLFEPDRVADEAARALEQEEELASLWADPARLEQEPWAARGERYRDEAGVLYRPFDEVVDELRSAGREVRTASAMAVDDSVPVVAARGWEPGTSPRDLLERCRTMRREGYDVVFCALPAEVAAVGTRLAEEGLHGSPVVASTLHGGFVASSLRLAVVTHTEWHARPPSPSRGAVRRRPPSLGELDPGELVVHATHGIGRYSGMETREVAGFTREYLVISYAAGDRLFVPSDSPESLQRYVGSEQPSLSRLGTADWERTKARVRTRVRDIAADLIRLYAARLHSPGHPYPSDSPWQRELEESFPFDETPDQLRAIDEVYADMAKPHPMDRLVCGDVGYGKTEVAVRAAFKAVVEGKQVAVLVPTTLLAQQHFQTFGDRFSPFPVEVAMLSRFVDPDEQRDVVSRLQTGEIDVVVGTHRLLGSDVAFNDLGLVVVDEEHRFGVAQKERLRQMRVEVDVLTMTATPIPRTLEMSMANIRDLSMIDTAPADRRPIRTFVGPFDERLVTAAIRRELARGGQVFVVHNRVQTIERERRRLERMVPEARIAVGHGQMDEDTLERTMRAFWGRETDVLLCTTIIEAGLDIPTVNTLIVDRADMLGLAQLYQLRGRVGRAGEQAYAYLFYPPNVRLSQTAHERLKTLAQHTDLGSGIAIAMRDLEIRGAGNLLGAEQSGHIEAVGFEMYVRLLEDAAAELKGERRQEPVDVRIDLPTDAFLPASYIEREPLRLAAYRRIAETETLADVADVRAELRDRYGPLPEQAETLCLVAELRAVLRRAGITDVSVAPHELHGRVAKLRPVSLDEAVRERLRSGYGRAVLSEATGTLLLPLGDVDGRELVTWLRATAEGVLVPASSEASVPSGA